MVINILMFIRIERVRKFRKNPRTVLAPGERNAHALDVSADVASGAPQTPWSSFVAAGH